jgi:hypothetical protein
LNFDSFQLPSPITIKYDNENVVSHVNGVKDKINTTMRHVKLRGHWLREQAQKGEIAIDWVPTHEMAADGLTKLFNE